MRESTCKDCRSWEEEMYWTHFQCHHFSQVLQLGFHQRLAIPEKYTSNLKRKLPEIVSLKAPSGTVWKVGVLIDDGISYLSEGWQDFVKENLLEEKDFLVFKSKGNGCFNVMMFDGQSMCEKEAAYFVRKCDHKENNNQRKRKGPEDSDEAVVASREYAVGKFKQQKSQNGDIAELQSSQRVTSGVARKKSRRTVMLNRLARTRQSRRNKEAATRAEADREAFPQIEETTKAQIKEATKARIEKTTEATLDINTTSLSNKMESKEKSSPFKSLTFHRLVMEEEKASALQLAQEAVTRDGFFIVMKPTHVYSRFYMSIPSAWVAKHLTPLGTNDVILNMNEKMWCTKMWYTRKKGSSGGLSQGWKTFALDNKLQEFDVCVFEPSVLSYNSVILNVKIFRAVEADGTSNLVPKEDLCASQKDTIE